MQPRGKQAERFGTQISQLWITEVDLSKRPFTLIAKESEDAEEVKAEIKEARERERLPKVTDPAGRRNSETRAAS